MEVTLDGSVDIRGQLALRRTTGGFKRAFFILASQGLTCMSLFGVSANLVMYLILELRQGASSAASNTSNWQGAIYFFAVIGAFVGDAYIGRYWASLVSQILGISGLVLLSLVATIPSLHLPPCEDLEDCGSTSPTKFQLGLFYCAIYILALGYGSNTPSIMSFGADQFDDAHPLESVQKVQFFNCAYVALTFGTLFSSLLLVYIENEGKWALAFWITAGSGAIGIAIFLIPTTNYRYHKPGGNPLPRIAQVVVACVRKKHVKAPLEAIALYEIDGVESAIRGSRKIVHTKSLRCFDKAATITDDEMDKSDMENRGPQIVSTPWRLCTVTQVEEVKWLCRMIPIWICTIFYSTAYTQVFSLFVIQGAAMDTHLGGFNVPPASLYAVDCVTVVISVIAFHYWLMPLARRWTGRVDGLSGLQRIGLGMPIVVLAILEAGILEMVRLRTRRNGENISILWQVPQYMSIGVSESFTYLGQLYFFYDQAPDAMRSMGSALTPASAALGNYVNMLLVLIVSRLSGSPGWIPDSGSIDMGHLDYFFFTVAILTIINFGLFCLISMRYKYMERLEISPSPQPIPLCSKE